MADTTAIKKDIEPYMRDWLADLLGVSSLDERDVPLTGGGSFRFDAVTIDGTVAACFLSSRARTVNGKENTGGVRKALNDARYLGLISGDCRRIMVFTDERFKDLIERRTERFNTEGVEFLWCPLPQKLQIVLDVTLDNASREQLGGR